MAKQEVDKIHELTEALKIVKAECGQLRDEVQKLSALKGLAQQIVGDLLQKCSECGKQLIALDLNKEAYTLTCDNSGCKRYRQPGKYLKKADFESLLGSPTKAGK